jgi:Rrf2 family nitric oxide-sensitive transcriptional repressor
MTFLSRKADYALLILWYLHKNQDGASAREIAEQFNLSKPFVANILKELCGKHFLHSQRGVNGGYTLARSVETISLGELIESLEEDFRFAECAGNDAVEASCSISPVCPVKNPIQEVHHRIRAVLDGLTLAELFRSPSTACGGANQLVHVSLAVRDPSMQIVSE